METSPDLPKAPPGYRLQWDDTPYHVEKQIFDHWRTLMPRERAEFGGRANRALHQALISELRDRFPQASEGELELRAAVAKYGEELVRRVTGLDLPTPFAAIEVSRLAACVDRDLRRRTGNHVD